MEAATARRWAARSRRRCHRDRRSDRPFRPGQEAGRQLWGPDVGADPATAPMMFGSPVLADGVAYALGIDRAIAPDAGRVFAVRIRDGSLLWSAPAISGCPQARVRPRFLAAWCTSPAGTTNVCAYDSRSGRRLWIASIDSVAAGTPLVAVAASTPLAGAASRRSTRQPERDAGRSRSTGTVSPYSGRCCIAAASTSRVRRRPSSSRSTLLRARCRRCRCRITSRRSALPWRSATTSTW